MFEFLKRLFFSTNEDLQRDSQHLDAPERSQDSLFRSIENGLQLQRIELTGRQSAFKTGAFTWHPSDAYLIIDRISGVEWGPINIRLNSTDLTPERLGNGQHIQLRIPREAFREDGIQTLLIEGGIGARLEGNHSVIELDNVLLEGVRIQSVPNEKNQQNKDTLAASV